MHKMYNELAAWWPLLSAPEDYAEEAAAYRAILEDRASPPLSTMLELGAGGGNNASHLKKRFDLTLTDLSPAMLAVSRALNPECEHILGDMRALRLGRTFDAVFLHDAVHYLTTADDLAAAMATAFEHLRPGGIALFVPDCTTETFKPFTSHGGHDAPDGRGLRYLEWSWDPDPADTVCVTEYAIALRNAGGSVEHIAERHLSGLFPESIWLALLDSARFVDGQVLRVPPEDRGELGAAVVAKRPA